MRWRQSAGGDPGWQGGLCLSNWGTTHKPLHIHHVEWLSALCNGIYSHLTAQPRQQQEQQGQQGQQQGPVLGARGVCITCRLQWSNVVCAVGVGAWCLHHPWCKSVHAVTSKGGEPHPQHRGRHRRCIQHLGWERLCFLSGGAMMLAQTVSRGHAAQWGAVV